MAVKKNKSKRSNKKRSSKKQTAPSFQGWHTSDQDEINRRRHRGAVESSRIKIMRGSDQGSDRNSNQFYSNYQVNSGSSKSYEVEIRSLDNPINTCSCPDHAVNRLGTCKHIEAILHKLAKGKKRLFLTATTEGSPLVEIFIDQREEKIKILWPQRSRPENKVHQLLDTFFSANGTLLDDPAAELKMLCCKVADAPKALTSKIRISQQIAPWLERTTQLEKRNQARRVFDMDVALGKRSLDALKVPLYPYQQEGMRHLAFTERALLADEMGLGKTIQAIAACELLRRLRGVQRVLVISPASLKAEWQEQIEKFSDLSSLIIQGPRAARLKQYRQDKFFFLCNYEQIRFDADEIQTMLAPDIIILDEAQRIKNWQTKTANAVKQLKSRYAFVLTGTPLENRIDEIYSIVQFLDPHLFGPLFRFNRDFYTLDENGHPTGYKNLDQLHHRLRPIMLRRRKEEVEGDLPARTDKNYFVSMTKEQEIRYDEYNTRVARLMAAAQRRPLRKEEWEKLQISLACMRMLCDTPYILDQECNDSPKLDELENIIDDFLIEDEHKIIIFSEWTRMLDLVCALADKKGIGYALHTGQVSQIKRRQEIRRFKDDPDCCLFLSSDSGSTGLNLQNADVVINLDLPWNPAKLEQRIARAWRKHQTRSVQVINLVCENSIEHRMLHLLDQKHNLAQEVIDGAGKIKSMKMPSGRNAFMEHMEKLMGEQLPQQSALPQSKPAATKIEINPLQQLHEESVSLCGERLDLLQVHHQASSKDQTQTIVAVVDHYDESLCNALEKSVANILPGQSLQVLDRASYNTIQQLIESGVLSLNQNMQTLYQSSTIDKPKQQIQKQYLHQARQQLKQAERKHSMAQVLADGSFVIEALPVLSEAVEGGLESLALLDAHEASPLSTLSINFIESHLVGTAKAPANTTNLVTTLREANKKISEKEAISLLESGAVLMQHVTETLNKAAFQ